MKKNIMFLCCLSGQSIHPYLVVEAVLLLKRTKVWLVETVQLHEPAVATQCSDICMLTRYAATATVTCTDTVILALDIRLCQELEICRITVAVSEFLVPDVVVAVCFDPFCERVAEQPGQGFEQLVAFVILSRQPRRDNNSDGSCAARAMNSCIFIIICIDSSGPRVGSRGGRPLSCSSTGMATHGSSAFLPAPPIPTAVRCTWTLGETIARIACAAL